jgi:membrane protease YdiL (CAAX protease family)
MCAAHAIACQRRSLTVSSSRCSRSRREPDRAGVSLRIVGVYMSQSISQPVPQSTSGRPGPSGPIVVLALTMRLVLFAVFQLLIGLLLAAAGVASPWSASVAWWPYSAVATSIVTFVFLKWRAGVEAFSMTSYFRPTRPGVRTDILLTLAVSVVGGTLAVVGTVALAPVLFADPQTANALLIQPLPLWAAVLAVVLFPITIALTELPLYFGYAQPRVAGLTRSAWATVLVPAVALSLQHATLPLVFDPAFLAWRALMFLGFALVLGWALWKRPRLLPYLIVVHFLLDLQAAVSILLVSGD